MNVKKVYIMLFIIVAMILFTPLKANAEIYINNKMARENHYSPPNALFVVDGEIYYSGSPNEIRVRIVGRRGELVEGTDYNVASITTDRYGYGTVTIEGITENFKTLYNESTTVAFVIGDGGLLFVDSDEFKPDEPTGERTLTYKASIIASVIRTIGIALSVIVLMVIGARMIVASAEEKSILKQSMPGYIVGVIIIVSMSLLPSLIQTITKDWI